MSPTLSVIICTRNRARLLERLLHALESQTLDPQSYEILVVDDGSEDDTLSVCHALQHSLPMLRWVKCSEGRGLASARNVGIQHAKADKLVFTDDDCIPADNWLEVMERALESQLIVAGAVDTPHNDLVKLCHNIAEFYGFMPYGRARPVKLIAGANMGFRRSALEAVDGFVPTPDAGEDMEVVIRMAERGLTPWFEPTCVVMHDPARTSWRAIFRYSYRHAASTIRLRNRYQKTLRTPRVLKSPWLLALCTPALAMAVTFRSYCRAPGMLRYIWTAPAVYALKIAWCAGAIKGLRGMSVETESSP